jgi:TatD DNase family protein
LVEIADKEEDWDKARALAESDPRVWWTPGFHPYVADKFTPETPGRLKAALRHPRAVAAGEMGLDYYKHCAVPRERQIEAFTALARAAVESGKPLVLHCREADAASTRAQEDMLAVLASLPPFWGEGKVRGVAHCFQGTIDNAKRFITLGFLIGIDGPVTYPKGEAVRALAAALPLESLVLETDSPYLPPQAHRGRRNEPSYLPAVAHAVAAARGLSVEEVSRATTANAHKLYGFIPSP